MADLDALPEHARANRAHWNAQADHWVAAGERQWAAAAPTWGQWGVPDDTVTLLPADMTGMRAVELGCGTAYVSGWMARRGAEVVGVDVSERQLATARRLADEHGIALVLHHASAEAVPEPDASFDFAVSEYGAAIWCEPHAWLAEAHRLLRPGGELAFLGNHPLVAACSPLDGSLPAGTELVRPWFRPSRLDWRDAVDEPGGIEFCPTIAEWFALFDRVGFDVVGYEEVQAPRDTTGTPFVVSADWAHRWPSEHVWWVRRR